MQSGIYVIENKVNGKKYVGSSRDVSLRLYDHRRYLVQGLHFNSHLQYAWNKYGEGAFGLRLIEGCPPDALALREQYYVDLFKSMTHGYNLRGPERLGEISEKSRAKMRASARTPERREKGRLVHLGRKRSPETCRRISEGNRGRKLSPEQFERFRQRMRDPERREKIAEGMRRVWATRRGCNE